MADSPTYRIQKRYSGRYDIVDEENETIAHVSRFNPGPMVSLTGGGLYSPALAKVLARAMTCLANDLEAGRA